MSNCACTTYCKLRMERGQDAPFPECAPVDRHFSISKTLYIKGADGECEREYEFYPQRYATLEDALLVVSTLPWGDYTVDDTPRFGMFPPFRGWPEQAAEKLEAKISSTKELVRTG